MKSQLTLAATCAALAFGASPAHAAALDILYIAGTTAAGTNDAGYQSFATSGQFTGNTWTVKGSSLTGADMVGGDLDRTTTFTGTNGGTMTVKAYLESFDLVIINLPLNSANFVDSALGADWAAITSPILVNAALSARSASGRISLLSGDNASTSYALAADETVKLAATARSDAIFAGTASLNLYDATSTDTIGGAATIGTGEAIATVTNGTTTAHGIVYWATGTTGAGGFTLAGERAFMPLKGSFAADLSTDGEIVMGNLINQLTATAIPEPASVAVPVGVAALGFVATRRRR